MNFSNQQIINELKKHGQVATELKITDIKYLEDLLLDSSGRLRCVPYCELKNVPQNDISYFCVKHGIYQIITDELVRFILDEVSLDELYDTIEIAAGNGCLGRSMGIKMTDSYLQRRPEMKAYYSALQQQTVDYAPDVLKMDAVKAVQILKPRNVVACWCTHLYEEKNKKAGGNVYGVDEGWILNRIKKYIHVGNQLTHSQKPILRRKHRQIQAPWLLSRSLEKQHNVIYIWDKNGTSY